MQHPLAYLTPAEIDARADALLEQVLALLRQGQPA
jgi:hypothetical protein